MPEQGNFLEEDENSTGVYISIFSNEKGKISISIKSRINPGEALQEVSTNDASKAQLIAVCDILDSF